MCGIVAIVGTADGKEEKLRLSLSKISHRGEPQHQFEHLVLDHVALGANRLAIVDEAFGQQPQQNEDGTIFAILNGEIFNFGAIAERLKGEGHVFRTHGDTEVLTHLWEDKKEALISELDSEMFAFIIFDKTSGEIFAARDRIGVKPLYYAYDEDGTMFFASEIKALVCFEDLNEIHEFPPGHYFYKGKFVSYYEIKIGEVKDINLDELKHLIEQAVFKRVQTDLPIAIFLSGGVDSSMVMELASRFHGDVTALILGEKDSPDYISALKLCEEKGWKYKSIEPKIDYEAELSDIIYFVESYDPNIVRHSFANNILSKYAHDLGFKIVLTGEGIDEIFGGYNEFLDINPLRINEGCKALLKSMSRGNLMRIDKMAMRHTVEIRCPFFDKALVDVAMVIDGSIKVGKYGNEIFTKFIFRKIALNYLSEATAFRAKAPFANGAGMNVGTNYKRGDGVIGQIAQRIISDEDASNIKRDFPGRDLETKEQMLIFKTYREFGYDKFIEGREPLVVKDTLK